MDASLTYKPTERHFDLTAWLTVERLAYVVIALVAVLTRAIGLGWWPLGPAEAWQALPALAAARGQPYDLTGLSPLLFTLQRLTFALFGANEILARMWGALVGGLAVLCFYALRNRLTRGGALAAAFLWAISPLAVFTARQGVGDGLTPAVALALLAIVNLVVGKLAVPVLKIAPNPPTPFPVRGPNPPTPFPVRGPNPLTPFPVREGGVASAPLLSGEGSGVRLASEGSGVRLAPAAAIAGLLLITGPTAYTVVLIGIIAVVYWRPALADLWAGMRSAWRSAAAAFVLALAFGATCFSLSPTGLAAAADLLGGWLVGLVPAAGEYGAWDIVRRLLISEPLTLGFGVVGLVSALRRGERFGRFIGIATGIALLVAVVGRGRHPLALGLVVLGLVILAGPAVAAALRALPRWRGQADPWLLVALELVLIVTAAQCVPGALNPTNRADWVQLYTALGIITFTMAVLLWLIYGAFGSWQIVAEALPIVLLAVGLAWNVSQVAGINYDRGAERRAGVLIVTPDAGGLTDLRGALRELAALKGTGAREARLDLMLPESMARTVAPILRWELRDLPNLRLVNAFPADRPPLAITAADATAAPGPTYGGAEFAVLRWWRPDALQGANAWVRWLIYREVSAAARGTAPAVEVVQNVVLWVDRATAR